MLPKGILVTTDALHVGWKSMYIGWAPRIYSGDICSGIIRFSLSASLYDGLRVNSLF